MLVLIWLLNFVISWFNAFGCGKAWNQAKAVGGWQRLVLWSVAIMSACGFTWCYLVILAYGAIAFEKLTPEQASGMFALGYLMIIIPIIGSGLVITVDSWAYYWKRRSLGGGVVAGWNTFAQISNTYRAVSAVPEAWKLVGKAFEGKGNAKSKAPLLLIVMVFVALMGGILTTQTIIKRTARAVALEMAPMPSRRRTSW